MELFEKKFTLIPLVFPKLFTPQDVDTWMHSRSCFRKFFPSQPVDGSQSLHKYAKFNFYPAFSTFLHRYIWKAWLFVRSLVWGPYVKRLFPDARYSDNNLRNLLEPLQMHLSQQRNFLEQYFISFLKCI